MIALLLLAATAWAGDPVFPGHVDVGAHAGVVREGLLETHGAIGGDVAWRPLARIAIVFRAGGAPSLEGRGVVCVCGLDASGGWFGPVSAIHGYTSTIFEGTLLYGTVGLAGLRPVGLGVSIVLGAGVVRTVEYMGSLSMVLVPGEMIPREWHVSRELGLAGRVELSERVTLRMDGREVRFLENVTPDWRTRRAPWTFTAGLAWRVGS